MSAQHTPGPWGSRRNQLTEVICGNGADVATIKLSRYMDNARHNADANLIAAAPEMYGELEMAVMYLGEQFDNDIPVDGAELVEWFAEWRKHAAAILAKAKGRT